MASRPETIVKMNKAWELHKIGLSIREIGERLQLSESRVRELLKGHNWNSARREYYPIA